MITKKTEVFIIKCDTGCTCCYDQNHYRGFYKTEEQAKKRIEYYKSMNSKFWPVASKYSNRGSYSIKKEVYENLEDGRVIFMGEVYTPGELDLTFVEMDNNGMVADNNSEKLFI